MTECRNVIVGIWSGSRFQRYTKYLGGLGCVYAI